MVRYEKIIAGHPPSYSEKRRRPEKSMQEYIERVRRIKTTTDNYWYHGSHRKKVPEGLPDIRTQQNLSRSHDFEDLRNSYQYNHNHYSQQLSYKDKKHNSMLKSEKYRNNEALENTFVNFTGLNKFEQAYAFDNRVARLNYVYAADLYELVDTGTQNDIIKTEPKKPVNQERGLAFVQELGVRLANPMDGQGSMLYRRPNNYSVLYNSLPEKQASGSTNELVDTCTQNYIKTEPNKSVNQEHSLKFVPGLDVRLENPRFGPSSMLYRRPNNYSVLYNSLLEKQATGSTNEPVGHGTQKDTKTEAKKPASQEHGLKFVPELDVRLGNPRNERGSIFNRRPNYHSVLYNSLPEKQATGSTKEVNVEDTSRLLTSRTLNNYSVNRDIYRPNNFTNEKNNQILETAESRIRKTRDEKRISLNDFPNKGNVSSPDALQGNTKPRGISSNHASIRHLRRPTRAKRMNLHKPELLVIPEVGGTFVHAENMDSYRQDMLSSLPLSSRSSHPTSKDKTAENQLV